MQLKTIRERLTRKSAALINLVTMIFQALYKAQKLARDHFLEDFECCCAGANDFVQMSEQLEDIVQDIRVECTLSVQAQEFIDNEAGTLLGLYTSDAVYAAQMTSFFIFKDIYDDEGITPIFFTDEWLDELQDNELAGQIVRTMEDYASDITVYLDDVMIQKALEALAKKCISFYTEQILKRATAHNSGRNSFFADNKRALQRMEGDMGVLKEFFTTAAEDDYPRLQPVINHEFDFFETVHMIMSVAGE